MDYTVDYFIKKFEAIPENHWTTFTQQNEQGQRCAIGHCAPVNAVGHGTAGNGGHYTEEGKALIQLFQNTLTIPDPVASINNGVNKKYQQPTPKQRILAALYDIKRIQQPQEDKTEQKFIPVSYTRVIEEYLVSAQ